MDHAPCGHFGEVDLFSLRVITTEFFCIYIEGQGRFFLTYPLKLLLHLSLYRVTLVMCLPERLCASSSTVRTLSGT